MGSRTIRKRSHLWAGPWLESIPKATDGKLGGVPQLVAEMAVAQDPVHVHVYIPS